MSVLLGIACAREQSNESRLFGAAFRLVVDRKAFLLQ